MKKDALFGVLFALISFVIFWISKDFSLFWDTIQFAGKHPLHFYENKFSSFFLPPEIDSGHFPLFGIYQAFLWTIIGKSLFTAHLSVLPFIFLSFYFSWELGKRWIGEDKALLFPILLLLIPQCISQFILVSPDVILICFFLGLLLGIESEKKVLIITSAILLVLVNNRGFLWVLVFILWLLLPSNSYAKRKQLILYILPAVIIFSGFQIVHFIQSGWSGFHNDMAWSESFELSHLIDLEKNFIVFIWRVLDFGMIGIWVGLVVIAIRNKKEFFQNRLILLIVLMITFLGIVIIPFSGLMQHRYFLPIYVLAGFILVKYISQSSLIDRIQMSIIGVVSIFLVTGNLWIYPDKIAQGWDSTLAHIPYYQLQKQMIQHIDSLYISHEFVGTAFPLRSPQKELFLTDNENQFSRKDLAAQDYILWSNIMNDYSDEEIDVLFEDWSIEKSLEIRNIKMVLFQKTQK